MKLYTFSHLGKYNIWYLVSGGRLRVADHVSLSVTRDYGFYVA
jgi:hypothetical protein